MIQIKLNGKPYKIRSGSTIENLLKANNLDSTQVGVELNESVVNQNEFQKVIIRNNDKVEVVEFVGGG